MARKEERLKYALSFKGKGMENEELKESIQLAILDGAIWADETMIDKACDWLKSKGGFTIGFDGATVRDFRKAMED